MSLVRAANKVVDATIAEVSERGFVLTVGADPLPVEDESGTRFWKGKAVAGRESFKAGDAITVRIRADRTPVVVREMADRPSWQWLERIRKTPQACTVSKVDAKYLTVQLADGPAFVYRITPKSDIVLGGKPASMGDLKSGMNVFVKGRTLPTLDTWVVLLSDRPIAPPVKTPKSKKPKTKPLALPQVGSIEGTLVRVQTRLRLFGVPTDGATVDFGYNAQTRFFLDGRSAGPDALQNGLRVVVAYHRDFVGRIIATKVELFSRSGT